MLAGSDHGGLWALLAHHLTTWGRAGARTSDNTLRTYKQGLGSFLGYVEGLGVRGEMLCEIILQPSTDLGAEYLRSLERRNLSPATVNNKRASAASFYRALRWAGATEANPFSDVPAVRDPTPRHEKRSPYTDEEMAALLATGTQPDERALLLLAGHAGLRVHEIAGLTWAMIDLKAGKLRVTGKGGKIATVSLSQSLRETLTVLPRREDGHVLKWKRVETLRDHIHEMCDRAAVTRRGVHALRHYSGTYMYKQTRNLDAVARHLRHSNIETSRIYAKWSDDMSSDVFDNW